MKGGYLLLLGSVALAIVGVGGELGPGYPRAAQADPIQLQYLPGAGPPPEDTLGRRKTQRGPRIGNRHRTKIPSHEITPLPSEFTGAYEGESGAAVPGEPGVDYPTYSEVPITSFTCEGKPTGYYADPETRCQTFHVCTAGDSASNSFICPNGTLFNPAVRTCDWWPAVDCGTSTDSLRIPQDIGRVRPKVPASLGPNRETRRRPQGRRRENSVRVGPSSLNYLPSQSSESSLAFGSSPGTDQQQFPLSVQSVESPSPQHLESSNGLDIPQEQHIPEAKTTTENEGEKVFERRRPKPDRLRKQKQPVRVILQETPKITSYDERENYQNGRFVNPTTSRSTQDARRENRRPQTITRFDLTRETLEFPSMRIKPTRPSYILQNEGYTSLDENTPKDTSFSNFNRPSYSFKSQDRSTPPVASTTRAPLNNNRRPYKASRLVTKSPLTTNEPIVRQPQSVRISAPNPPRVSFVNREQNRPVIFTPASPGVNQYLHLPNTQAHDIAPVTSTRSPIMENIFKPVAVTSPGLEYSSFAAVNSQSSAQFNVGFSSTLGNSDRYTTFTTGSVNSFSPPETDLRYKSSNNPKTLKTEQPLNPTQDTPSRIQNTNIDSHLIDHAQTLTPTQETFLTTQNTLREYKPLVSGYTQSLLPTQSIFTGPQFNTDEQTPLRQGNENAVNPTQISTSSTVYNTEGFGNFFPENTKPLSPTQSSFTDSHYTNRETSLNSENTKTSFPTQSSSPEHRGNGLINNFPGSTHDSTENTFTDQSREPFSLTDRNKNTFNGSPGTIASTRYNNEVLNTKLSGNTQPLFSTVTTGSFFTDQKETYPTGENSESFSSALSTSTDTKSRSKESSPNSLRNNEPTTPLQEESDNIKHSTEKNKLFPTDYSQSSSNTLDFKPTGIAQSFAQSIAISNNAFNGFSQTFPSQAAPTESFTMNKDQLIAGVAQSFASADSFVSDEGFSSPPASSTNYPSRPSFISTTPKPITSTVRATTLKLVYTPTVPQTTARPTTTAKPIPKKTTSIATTTTANPRPVTSAPKPTAYLPGPINSFSSNDGYSQKFNIPVGATPTTASPSSSSTKKIKGFYITYAPPTRPATPNQQLKTDVTPKGKYLPPSTYLPPTPASTTTSAAPSPHLSAPDLHYSKPLPPPSQTTLYSSSQRNTPSFTVVSSVSQSFDGSGFKFNPYSAIEYQPSMSYGLPQQSTQQNKTNVAPAGQPVNFSTTTEPSFVIQKSVELFSAHEVGYHPSVFAQSSYSLSPLQDDYNKGDNNKLDLKPPPFLSPSPNARGFGRWNTESDDEKQNSRFSF